MRVFKGFLILAILSLVTYYGFFTENMTYAKWGIDQTPPTVATPVLSKTCFTVPNDFPLTVTSDINEPANPSSGIKSCQFKLNGDSIPSSLTNPSNNTPPVTPGSPSTANCTASILTCTSESNEITVTAEDRVGNPGFSPLPPVSFNCAANCNPGPWIKTTGGDVHTNESINIP